MGTDDWKGKAKEAAGALTDDQGKKEEGKADQRKAKVRKEKDQAEKTRAAKAEANREEGAGGGLLGGKGIL
jgi:uncharacterized protein YjbJ (UPF0337 family)